MTVLARLKRRMGGDLVPLAAAVTLLMILPASGLGQAAAEKPAGAAYVPTMVFDVASVRENKEADLRRGITMSGQFTPHTTNLRLTLADRKHSERCLRGPGVAGDGRAEVGVSHGVRDRGEGRCRCGGEDGGASGG